MITVAIVIRGRIFKLTPEINDNMLAGGGMTVATSWKAAAAIMLAASFASGLERDA